MNYAKVKDHPGLARDESTDQIVNTNIHEYQQYVTRREKRKAEKAWRPPADSAVAGASYAT